MSTNSRDLIVQTVVLIAVAAIVAVIAMQTTENLRRRGIASGFAYLDRAAGFAISSGPVSFTPRDTYARALGVGLINTLRVSLLAVVIATVLGVGLGVGRLSRNPIASSLASAYVEVIRNTPLLLQLFFWYSLTQALPAPREALQPFAGAFLCFRGLYFPSVIWHDEGWSFEYPQLVGFDFQGGTSISPEFGSLLVGLSIYTAAFIGEIVRGGILAVSRGQRDAAAALGLSRGRTLRLVVLPQALPVIVPPATSQFLGLVKNSSLAVAIGYSDLFSVTSTTLNQTGQAIEALTLAMLVYLAISLAISLAMNLYNRSVAVGEREHTPARVPEAAPSTSRLTALDCRITSLDPRWSTQNARIAGIGARHVRRP